MSYLIILPNYWYDLRRTRKRHTFNPPNQGSCGLQSRVILGRRSPWCEKSSREVDTIDMKGDIRTRRYLALCGRCRKFLYQMLLWKSLLKKSSNHIVLIFIMISTWRLLVLSSPFSKINNEVPYVWVPWRNLFPNCRSRARLLLQHS